MYPSSNLQNAISYAHKMPWFILEQHYSSVTIYNTQQFEYFNHYNISIWIIIREYKPFEIWSNHVIILPAMPDSV